MTNTVNKFIIRDREAGNFITDCETKEMAEKLIFCYEREDRLAGAYVKNFYEIYNTETEEVEN